MTFVLPMFCGRLRTLNGKEKMERSEHFFPCVPEGRAKRVAFGGCIMGDNTMQTLWRPENMTQGIMPA
jgi:hypothetical protein